MNYATLVNTREYPIIDEEFDWLDSDIPLASDDEEATYQRWVDIDLMRKLGAL